MGKVILTGDRPTGRLHIGHYVGSLRERVMLQNQGDFDKIFIMIADAQALTDNAENPQKVRDNIIEVALDYLACGIDPEKSTILIQSMIPELTELTFYYMNLVTIARVQRNPTVKTEIKMRNFEMNIPVGFFVYPIILPMMPKIQARRNSSVSPAHIMVSGIVAGTMKLTKMNCPSATIVEIIKPPSKAPFTPPVELPKIPAVAPWKNSTIMVGTTTNWTDRPKTSIQNMIPTNIPTKPRITELGA